MVLVQPDLQIVLLIFACVTFGLVAPGVLKLSGQVRLLASPARNVVDIRLNANRIALIIRPLNEEGNFYHLIQRLYCEIAHNHGGVDLAHAAARSSLSTPRATILSASSG